MNDAVGRQKIEALELLGEQIAEHAAHLDAATHRLLCDIRAFDQEGGWAVQGARSCAQWLSWRVGWGTGTAREHVRVASKLAELPLIDDALRRGEISYCKVRAITRVALPTNEETLLMYAKHSTGAQLEEICRKYGAVLRHDEGTRPHEDVERRYVTRVDTADGMVKIVAVLHPEEAALVWASLDRTATELCRDTSPGHSDVPAESTDAVARSASDTTHAPVSIALAGSAESTADASDTTDVVAGVVGAARVPAESSAGNAADTLDAATAIAATAHTLGESTADASDTTDVAAGVVGAARVPAESSAGGAAETMDVATAIAATAHTLGESTAGGAAETMDVATAIAATTDTLGESTAGGAAETMDVATAIAATADTRGESTAGGAAETMDVATAIAATARGLTRSTVAVDRARTTSRASDRPAFSRADALVAIAEEIVRGTRRERSAIEIALSVPAETLKAGHLATGSVAPAAASHLEPGRNEIDPTAVACFRDGTCISAHAARRLACDCGVVDVVEDEHGIALSIGRRRRVIPPAMKAALLRRDRTCQFPGCRTRVFLQGHHLEHWADGGETKLENLTCLCTHHHRYVHEYGYSITMSRDGEVEIKDALGRLVPQVPALPQPVRRGRETIIELNAPLAISAETPACGWDGVPIDYVLAVDGLVAVDGR